MRPYRVLFDRPISQPDKSQRLYALDTQGLGGDCTINNSGTIITFAALAIEFSSIHGGGTHTIINSGLIEGAIENLSADGIERVTNSGQHSWRSVRGRLINNDDLNIDVPLPQGAT